MDWNVSVSLGHHLTEQTDYSLLNASILSVSNQRSVLVPAVQSHDFLEIYDYVFNTDTADGTLSQNVTSQSLVSYLMYLQTVQTNSSVQFVESNMLSYLQAFVTLPLLLLQPTSTTDYRTLFGVVPDLVPNVTTTAVYSETVSRILIAKWTAFAFIAMTATVYCQSIICLYWATRYSTLDATPFPLLDFFVALYNWNRPIARLLSSRGEVDSGVYRQNLEGQVLVATDGAGNGVMNDAGESIERNCYI
jgi:hypothetical protein